jgi:hypothetical protein
MILPPDARSIPLLLHLVLTITLSSRSIQDWLLSAASRVDNSAKTELLQSDPAIPTTIPGQWTDSKVLSSSYIHFCQLLSLLTPGTI